MSEDQGYTPPPSDQKTTRLQQFRERTSGLVQKLLSKSKQEPPKAAPTEQVTPKPELQPTVDVEQLFSYFLPIAIAQIPGGQSELEIAEFHEMIEDVTKGRTVADFEKIKQEILGGIRLYSKSSPILDQIDGLIAHHERTAQNGETKVYLAGKLETDKLYPEPGGYRPLTFYDGRKMSAEETKGDFYVEISKGSQITHGVLPILEDQPTFEKTPSYLWQIQLELPEEYQQREVIHNEEPVREFVRIPGRRAGTIKNKIGADDYLWPRIIEPSFVGDYKRKDIGKNAEGRLVVDIELKGTALAARNMERVARGLAHCRSYKVERREIKKKEKNN